MKTKELIDWLQEYVAGMRDSAKVYWCPHHGEITPDFHERCELCGTFVGGEPDTQTAEMLDTVLFQLREFYEEDENIRRQVHKLRGHADDRDFATSLEVAGRLGELSAAESDAEELGQELGDYHRTLAQCLGYPPDQPLGTWEDLLGEVEVLSAKIAHLTRERDEARAERDATNFDPSALIAIAPDGWTLRDADPTPEAVWTWVHVSGAHVYYSPTHGWFSRLPNGSEFCGAGPLVLMRAADKALASKEADNA